MYDVAIIGGGPAGSTAAALLARAGRRVVLFEREKFPRFHIGESLLPFSMKAFTRLGLHEKFLSAGFLKKYGGEIMGACSDTGTKFYFKDGYRSQTDHAYQVTRSDFDKVLLDHAAESGAEVHEQTLVSNVMFRADEVTLSYKSVSCNEVGSARCADRTSQRDVPTTEGESRRVTLSMPADAPRCSEGNSRSRRPMIIFKSCRSSRITMVCGVRKELTAR